MRPRGEDGVSTLRAEIDEIANELCRAVDGELDFAVHTPSEDETVQKLGLLVSFVLEAARRATRASAAARRRLELVLETVPSPVFTVDLEKRITSWNAAAEELFAVVPEDAIGRVCTDVLECSTCREGCGLFDPGVAKPIHGRECTVTTPDGRTLLVAKNVAELRDGQGRVVGGVESVEDLTARRRLEADLRQAQKLEAVGRLAAGLAHEINTPMQFVSDSVTFLEEAHGDLRALLERYREALRAGPADAGTIESLEEAEDDADLGYLDAEVPKAFSRTRDGADRVTRIVRAMKEFGRSDTRDKVAADLNRAAESTATVCRNEYKYVADLELDLGELPPVLCHVGDINQVLLSLIVNAAQAIGAARPRGERGTIRIRTRVDGPHVLVDVADDGPGIPAEIRGRVFDPFFTTKEVGAGSGQGLAIARSIVVDKHGGEISFETEEGEGTTFRLRLPIDGGAVPTRGAIGRATRDAAIRPVPEDRG